MRQIRWSVSLTSLAPLSIMLYLTCKAQKTGWQQGNRAWRWCIKKYRLAQSKPVLFESNTRSLEPLHLHIRLSKGRTLVPPPVFASLAAAAAPTSRPDCLLIFPEACSVRAQKSTRKKSVLLSAAHTRFVAAGTSGGVSAREMIAT